MACSILPISIELEECQLPQVLSAQYYKSRNQVPLFPTLF